MYVKKHESKDRIVFAVCDEDLIGKKFQEGDLVLDVSERFYKGEKKTNEEIKEIFMNSSNINLVGKKTINFALKLGILNKDSIITVDGIPHAQIVEV
jgi:uncharacterized protein